MSITQIAAEAAITMHRGIVLEIPRIAPSPNIMLRAHWSRRHKLQQLWQEEVGWGLQQQGYSQQRQPYARARVSIDRRSRGILDPDNLVGSCKPILDALRWAHVLVDDTPEHLELIVTQSRGKPDRTRIEIRPLVGAARIP